jgi:integrase
MDCVRRRGKVYNVVVTVPADLVEVIGKKQLWRSLKTKSYDVARSEARQMLHTVEQIFRQIRGGMDSRLINGMAAEYGLENLADYDKASKGLATFDAMKGYVDYVRSSPERRKLAVNLSDEIADACNQSILDGRHEDVLFAKDWAKLFISKYRLSGLIEEDEEIEPEEFKEVVAAFAQTERQLHKAHSERLQGISEIESDFQHRLLEKWNKDKLVKKDVGIPITDLLKEYGAQWKNDNPHQVARKIAELLRIDESFRECFNKVLRVKEIDDDKAEEWRNYLQHEYHSDRGMIMANKSVDNYIGTISAVFNWGIVKKRGKRKGAENCNSKKPLHKYLEVNPFDGLKLGNYGEPSEQSRIFSVRELQKYVEVLYDYHLPEYSELTWLPLIMMYSGMRCNEVAQLYLDDVQTEEDTSIDFIRITKNVGRQQWVKCKSSVRSVPIHTKLKELGFMEYVARMREAGEERVFPNCKHHKGSGGYYSDAMSTRLNSAINIHISVDRKLRLYSMRANFRTGIAKSSPIRGEQILDQIMGHSSKGGMGSTYTKFDIYDKATVVDSLEYPVDLSRLQECLNNA